MICPYCERGQCALARHDHEPDCECPRCFPEHPPELPEDYLDAEQRFLAGQYESDPWAEEELKTMAWSANGEGWS